MQCKYILYSSSTYAKKIELIINRLIGHLKDKMTIVLLIRC